MTRILLILALAGCSANRSPLPGDVTAEPGMWEMGGAGEGSPVTDQGQDQPAGSGMGAPVPAQPLPAGAPAPMTPSDAGTQSADQGDAGAAGSGGVSGMGGDAGCFDWFGLPEPCEDPGTGGMGGTGGSPPVDCDATAYDCMRDECGGGSTVDDTDQRPWDVTHPMWGELHVDSNDRCLWPVCQDGVPNRVVARPDGYVNEGNGVCFVCMSGVPYFEPCP